MSSFVLLQFVLVSRLTFFLSSSNSLADLYGTLNFWLSMLLVQIVAIGPKFIWKYLHTTYSPQDGDIVREMAILGMKGRGPQLDPEDSSYTDLPPPETREALPLVAPQMGGSTRSRQISGDTFSEPYSPQSSSNAYHSSVPIPSPFGPAHSGSPFSSPRLATAPPLVSPTLHSVPQSIPTVAIIGSTPSGSLHSRYSEQPTGEDQFDVLAYQRQSMAGGTQESSTSYDLQSQSPLDAWRRGQAQAQVLQQSPHQPDSHSTGGYAM